MSVEQYMATINGVKYVKWEFHNNVNGHLIESTKKVMAERDELKSIAMECLSYLDDQSVTLEEFCRSVQKFRKWKSQTGGGE